MRKTLIALILFISLAFKAAADEGMWLPLLLGQQVYNDMVRKGLKLTKEQLYSINKASLKDAIVIFNGGCTGEMVSPQGMVFTNHHCGYSVIAAASTLDHNYLQNGFYSRNMGEEIPGNLQNLYVEFLSKIEDVTKLVLDSLNGLSGQERVDRQNQILAAINARMSDASKHIQTSVSPLFKGNQFLAFVYQRYTDLGLLALLLKLLENLVVIPTTGNGPAIQPTIPSSVCMPLKDGSPADYQHKQCSAKTKMVFTCFIKRCKRW